MRKEGYRESTCYFSVGTLKRLDRKVNCLEPESVKRFLANSNWSEGGKERVAEDLGRFYKFKGIQWERPRYEAVDTLPYIPKEANINELISDLSATVGTFCLLLKETGCRPCEGWAGFSRTYAGGPTERMYIFISPNLPHFSVIIQLCHGHAT